MVLTSTPVIRAPMGPMWRICIRFSSLNVDGATEEQARQLAGALRMSHQCNMRVQCCLAQGASSLQCWGSRARCESPAGDNECAGCVYACVSGAGYQSFFARLNFRTAALLKLVSKSPTRT